MIHLYHHSDCDQHIPGATHPENPGRTHAIMTALQNSGLAHALVHLPAALGTDAQVLLAHTAAHLARIRAGSPAHGTHALDPDTILSPGSLTAALRGVGAACQGVDDLMTGKARSVFCLTRPPGHHATADTAMGFCIFNHIAIAARYALTHYHVERVAIIDFDVHHGNGTQDIFAGATGVLYLSTHQSPLYPGTGGTADNIPGNICNIPLAAGTAHAGYQEVFTATALPVLRDFKPQLMLVSAGFDAHHLDPLAGLSLTEDTYRWLGIQLGEIAAQNCAGKLLTVLEGGYNQMVLGNSVLAYLEGLVQSMKN